MQEIVEWIGDYESIRLAILVRDTERAKGNTSFFTDPKARLQLGLVARKAGELIPRHRHTEGTQEALVVRRGAIAVTVGKDKVVLGEGDCILLQHGAHSVEFLTDAELLELKSGPYVDDKEYE